MRATESPALSVASLSKTFPGQRAVDDVGFSIQRGEVYGLVGQNGSGKSTIIKTLAGFHHADPGARAELYGEPLDLEAGSASRTARLRCIHQNLGLVDSLNAIDNISLGSDYLTTAVGRIRWRAERRRARDAIRQYGMDFDVTVPVAELSAAERTVVAIARATRGWSGAGGVLVLDEPTVALPAPEVQRLFTTIRQLARAGAGVLFVSHRLEEVLELCDRIGVLRDGRLVAQMPVSELSHDTLVELIAGRPIDHLYPEPAVPRDKVVLRAVGLGAYRLARLDLDVHEGEIVGVTGLLGSGREEVADALFGSLPASRGEVSIDGTRIAPRSPSACVRRGLAMVPRDRVTRALISRRSARENITLPDLRPLYQRAHLSRARERQDVARWAQAVQLSPPDTERAIEHFSGGNQQKVVLARWLRTRPRALVLDEPAQGVDVGARSAIYRLLADNAAQGMGIVVCSAEIEDLAEICDRVLVLRTGSVTHELRGRELTKHALLVATLGGSVASRITRNSTGWS